MHNIDKTLTTFYKSGNWIGYLSHASIEEMRKFTAEQLVRYKNGYQVGDKISQLLRDFCQVEMGALALSSAGKTLLKMANVKDRQRPSLYKLSGVGL